MLSEDVQAGKTTTPSSWRRGGEDSFYSKTEVQTFLRKKKKKKKNYAKESGFKLLLTEGYSKPFRLLKNTNLKQGWC